MNSPTPGAPKTPEWDPISFDNHSHMGHAAEKKKESLARSCQMRHALRHDGVADHDGQAAFGLFFQIPWADSVWV